MSKTITPTNGKAEPAKEITQTAKVTPITTQVSSKSPSTDLPPLEDRLHRLNQLFDLQRKYSKLQDSLQKLNEFEIKKDGERSRITIADDSRNDFTTYQPEIVNEVVEFIKVKIKDRIKAIEPLLKW